MTYKSITDEELKLAQNKDLSETDLSGRTIENIVLFNTKFNNCNLQGTKFSNVNLANCSFKSSDLSSSRFMSCNLYRADFSYCDLTESKIIHSKMRSVNLKRANILNCNFRASILEDANFSLALNKKKNPIVGQIYELTENFEYRASLFDSLKITETHGMVVSVHKDGSFDLLLSEKVFRNIPSWANYSLIGKKLT